MRNCEKLKSCPFCGGKAILEDMGYPHHVVCTECGARTTGLLYAEDGEAQAMEKWNRRAKGAASVITCHDCTKKKFLDDKHYSFYCYVLDRSVMLHEWEYFGCTEGRK